MKKSNLDSRDEMIRFTKYFTETIHIMYTSIKTKNNTKHSANTINVAMLLLLWNKKSYDVLCESALMGLPHPNSLKPALRDLKIIADGHLNIYINL